MTLTTLLADPETSLMAVEAWLNERSHDERVAATRNLSRTEQRMLYTLAAASEPLNLSDFVPASVDPLQPVRHHGTNTLPLPGGLRRFEKRFCRPEDADDHLFGYNEGATRSLLGPGYFVAVPTAGEASWEDRGSVVIDYFRVPDGPVAEGWPRVKPNSSGLQVLVYHQTRDFMRRVSMHVSIGAAFKKERSLDHYFTLVRED